VGTHTLAQGIRRSFCLIVTHPAIPFPLSFCLILTHPSIPFLSVTHPPAFSFSLCLLEQPELARVYSDQTQKAIEHVL
jgi:hypothetical protein